MEGNAVKKHLVEFIRQRLAEHNLFISNETLEYTAERYAWLIMDNPKLSVSELLNHDIDKLKMILREISSKSKAG